MISYQVKDVGAGSRPIQGWEGADRKHQAPYPWERLRGIKDSREFALNAISEFQRSALQASSWKIKSIIDCGAFGCAFTVARLDPPSSDEFVAKYYTHDVVLYKEAATLAIAQGGDGHLPTLEALNPPISGLDQAMEAYRSDIEEGRRKPISTMGFRSMEAALSETTSSRSKGGGIVVMTFCEKANSEKMLQLFMANALNPHSQIRQLAKALSTRGLLARDMKLDHLHLAKDGHLCVIDVGLYDLVRALDISYQALFRVNVYILAYWQLNCPPRTKKNPSFCSAVEFPCYSAQKKKCCNVVDEMCIDPSKKKGAEPPEPPGRKRKRTS